MYHKREKARYEKLWLQLTGHCNRLDRFGIKKNMPIDGHWLWCNCPKLLQRFDMSSIWDLAALPEQIKKRELNKHFLNNRFWFETYTMTITRFSVAHALWMPKTYALLGDRSARAVSGSVLITVNKQIILFKYKPTVLKTYFMHVRLYVQKSISVIFF